MTVEEQNTALVQRWVQQVFNKKEWKEVEDIKDPVSYHSHNPFPGTTPNLNGFKSAFSQVLTAFPDFSFTIDEVVAKGDVVVVRGTWTGTHKGVYMGVQPTGKQVSVSRIDMLRVSGGKIVEHWGFGDDWHKIRSLAAR
ncbi:MAG TPA: ester cyclase [Blastocatellia bacterium]|jgi:predicted ester cyclase